MINYENLQDLEKDCRELLYSTVGMISGSNERKIRRSNTAIKKALRKIVIANELMGKGVICISGLQGAGKTTLLKNFYGIGENILNVSLQRGENVPIFVVEKKDCKDTELYNVCLNKTNESYEKYYQKLTSKEFITATTGGENTQDIMYLEVRVPYKHFRNESGAFLLLPGFEKRNNYWQTLVEFSVNCSDASIFVFNESSFAKIDNQELLEKLNKTFGDNLIYAITHSDESQDDNAEVKKNFIHEMKISASEEDRVICVGEYADSSKNNEWILQLKTAIEKYCNSIDTANDKCRQYVYDIIEDEIRPEIATIKEIIGSDTADAIYIKLENEAHLDAFDKIVKIRRKQLSDQLDQELQKAYCKSCKKLEKVFTDKEYAKSIGIKDKRRLQRAIFGENAKDLKFARERVDECMKGDDGNYNYQYSFISAVDKICSEIKDKNAYKEIEVQNLTAISEMDLFADEDIIKPVADKTNDQTSLVVQDAAFLLTKNTDSKYVLRHDNPADTMKVIAELGTVYFCLATQEEVAAVNSQISVPDIEIGTLNLSVDDFKKKVTQVDKVILGTLGITGIDIMGDGVINAIPMLADSLGLSIPIVSVAVGAIIGTSTGVAVVKDMNRLQRIEQTSAESAIASIHSQVKKQYLSAYDDAMDKIRNRIEENIIARSGYNQKIHKKTNAMIAITRIEKQLDSISEEVSREDYDLRRAFRG